MRYCPGEREREEETEREREGGREGEREREKGRERERAQNVLDHKRGWGMLAPDRSILCIIIHTFVLVQRELLEIIVPQCRAAPERSRLPHSRHTPELLGAVVFR